MIGVGFQSILVLLGVAVALLAIFRRLRMPHLLAYICAGTLIGPHGLGWVADSPQWHTLGEFGLVFLMFTIGLEFSWPRLTRMKSVVFGLGGAQVLCCCVVFGGMAWLLGVRPSGAIVVGAILAMSSTAIVMKLLFEQFEQHTRHGRYAFGVLLFQDLAVVPFLILIPALADGSVSVAATLGTAVAKGGLVLVVMFAIGRWLLRPLFHRVAATRVREYFMLTVLLLTLSAAWLTELAGLSLALGAFLAGMTLAETEYRHQVEADILPFRDILLGLFFMTVGMRLDLALLREYWHVVLSGLCAVLVFKTILIAALGKLLRMETGVALRTGLVLSQVGEFGFALLLLAAQLQVLEARTSQVLLAIIVLSMFFAPLIVWYSGRLARRLVPSYRQTSGDPDLIRREGARHQQHVIICGYGRSGQNLAWMLEQANIPSLALDLDPLHVTHARDAGKSVVYGDATRRDLLEASGLTHARALVVCINEAPPALKILEIMRSLAPKLPVLVRTVDDAHLEALVHAGATDVVPESIEGSLMMGARMLTRLGMDADRIDSIVQQVRRDRYHMLRGFFHGQTNVDNRTRAAYRGLTSVTLDAGARAVGKTLGDVDLNASGVALIALRRGSRQEAQPAAGTRLNAGDVLVLDGTFEALAKAEEALIGP